MLFLLNAHWGGGANSSQFFFFSAFFHYFIIISYSLISSVVHFNNSSIWDAFVDSLMYKRKTKPVGNIVYLIIAFFCCLQFLPHSLFKMLIFYFFILGSKCNLLTTSEATWQDIFVKHEYWSWLQDGRVLVVFFWRQASISNWVYPFALIAQLLSVAVCGCVVDGCLVGLSKNLRLFGPDKEKYWQIC